MYVLFLAVNGVTEGFMFALMSQAHIDKSVRTYYDFVHYRFLLCRHNYLLTVSSVLYLTASYVLTQMCGSSGLVLANCVNMAVRIVCSLLFIRDFFSMTPYYSLKRSVPSVNLLIAFIITLVVTSLSEVVFMLYL